MSFNPHFGYDPYVLFDEYVERIQDDSDDPELKTIETLIEQMGLKVKIPDEEREEFERDPLGHYIRYTANAYLVDPAKNEPPLAEVEHISIVVTCPCLEFSLTSEDYKFLREQEIRW